MARYRKKPIVVEAEQWFPGKKIVGVEERETGDPITEVRGVIQTLEWVMTAIPGDWIITGIKGERYPCKRDIFEATYERVDE